MLSLSTFIGNKTYFSAAFVFCVHSLLFSSWIIYIPYVAEKLDLSEGMLGAALFCLALGALSILSWAHRLIRRFGEGQVTLFGTLAMAILIPFPLAAPSFLSLCIVLFFTGIAAGLMDIAMNALIAAIEKKDKVFIMSGSHGFFSLGGMVGAGVGSFVAAAWQNPLLHSITVSISLILLQLVLKGHYQNVRLVAEPTQTKAPFSWKPLMGFAAIGLFIMVGEGAIADWSALYLKEEAGASASFIGLGYAGFSLTMALGRFFGDWISKQAGSYLVIGTGCFVGILGMALILTAREISSILGFTLVGAGFSVIVPELYRASSSIPGVEPSKGVSFIAGSGYVGFLSGPVILGLIAEVSSLRGSFVTLLFLTFTAFIVAVLSARQQGSVLVPRFRLW